MQENQGTTLTHNSPSQQPSNNPAEETYTSDVPMKRTEEAEGGIAMWDEAAPLVRTNYDEGSKEGRIKISQGMFAADMKIRNAAKTVHKIVGYVAHAVNLATGVPGEILPRVRLVMFRDDGKTISTMSIPCVRSFAYIAAHAKPEDWQNGIEIDVQEFPLEGGKSYCNLREVDTNAKTIQGKKHKNDS